MDSPTRSSGVTERARRSSRATTRARTVRSARFASRSSKQRAHLVERAQHRVLERVAGPPPDLRAAQPALGRPRDSALGVVDDDGARRIGTRVGEDRAVIRRARLPNVEKVAAVDTTEE